MTKIVVITGSTRGIGYGLADSFLTLGCSVVVSGRSAEKADEAAQKLSARHESERIFCHPCDVSVYEQVQALWDTSIAHFGKVDIWVNNSGISNRQAKFWELSPSEFAPVIQTNVLGSMYGSKVALCGMRKQNFGAIYNMLGMGSTGHKQDGMAPYGTSKAALRYLTDSLSGEVKGTSILIGAILPGMVITDMIMASRENSPDTWEQFSRILNIIGDRVETVTPWIAQKVLDNRKNGAYIRWTTTAKMAGRFLTAPFKRRNIVS